MSATGPAAGEGRRGPFARLYGAGPLHLLGHLLLIAVLAWAASTMFEARFAPEPLNLVLWLLGGAVVHDAVLLPAYSVLNAAFARAVAADRGRRIPLLNHVRVPLVIAGVLLLVFLPGILDLQPGSFERALGHERPDLLARYLVVVALLFAGSALVWVARAARSR